MTEEQKMESLSKLRIAFVDFMEVAAQLPGSPIQKQQAFIRFDEGHMWMQNSVVTFVEPPHPPAVANEAQSVIDNTNEIVQPVLTNVPVEAVV